MDDIAITTLLIDMALHIEMIHNLFLILTTHRLHLKLSKSGFLQPQIDFLSVWINKDDVAVNPTKLAGLWEYPQMLHNLHYKIQNYWI
jgi:hypothetical protein